MSLGPIPNDKLKDIRNADKWSSLSLLEECQLLDLGLYLSSRGRALSVLSKGDIVVSINCTTIQYLSHISL